MLNTVEVRETRLSHFIFPANIPVYIKTSLVLLVGNAGAFSLGLVSGVAENCRNTTGMERRVLVLH
jgi:hypothetical protein